MTRALQDYLRYNMMLFDENNSYMSIAIEAVDLQLIESDVSVDGDWHYFHLQGHIIIIIVVAVGGVSSSSATTATTMSTLVQQEQDSVLHDLQHLQAFLRQELDDTQLRVQEVYLFERSEQQQQGYNDDDMFLSDMSSSSSNKNSGLEMVLIGSLVGFAVLLAVAIVIYARWRYVQRRNDNDKKTKKKKNDTNRRRAYRPLAHDDDDDAASAFSRASSQAGLLLDRYRQSLVNVSAMADSICTSTSSLAGSSTLGVPAEDELPPTNTSDDTLLYVEDDDSEEEEEINGKKNSSARVNGGSEKNSSFAFSASDYDDDDDDDESTCDTNDNINNDNIIALQFDPNHPEPRPLDDCNRSLREEISLLQQSFDGDQPETTVESSVDHSIVMIARNELDPNDNKDNNSSGAVAPDTTQRDDDANPNDFGAIFAVQEAGTENHSSETDKEDSFASNLETTKTQEATLSDPASTNKLTVDDLPNKESLSQAVDESVGYMVENVEDQTSEEAAAALQLDAINGELHSENSNSLSIGASEQVYSVCLEEEFEHPEECDDAESVELDESEKAELEPAVREEEEEEAVEEVEEVVCWTPTEDEARSRPEQDCLMERSVDDGASDIESAKQNLEACQESVTELITRIDEGDESESDDVDQEYFGGDSSIKGISRLGSPEEEQECTNDSAVQKSTKAIKTEDQSSQTKPNEPLGPLSFPVLNKSDQESSDDVEEDCNVVDKSENPETPLLSNEDNVQEQEDSEEAKEISLRNTFRDKLVENAISNVKQIQKSTNDSSEPASTTIIIEEDSQNVFEDCAMDGAVEKQLEVKSTNQENDQDRADKAAKECAMKGFTKEIGETTLLAEENANVEREEQDLMPSTSFDHLAEATLSPQKINEQFIAATSPGCMNNERIRIGSPIEMNDKVESRETTLHKDCAHAESVDEDVETGAQFKPTEVATVVKQSESNTTVQESTKGSSNDLGGLILESIEESSRDNDNYSTDNDLAIGKLKRDQVTSHSANPAQCTTNLGEPIDTTISANSSLLDESMTPKLSDNTDTFDADLAGDRQRTGKDTPESPGRNVMLGTEPVESTTAIEESDRYGARNSSQDSTTDKRMQSTVLTGDDFAEAEMVMVPDQVCPVVASASTATSDEEDSRDLLFSPDTSNLVQEAERILGEHDCGRPIIHSQQIMATPELLRRSEHVLARHENLPGADTRQSVADNTHVDSPVRVVSFENGSPSKHLEASGDDNMDPKSLPGKQGD